jgi:hypothetical protein
VRERRILRQAAGPSPQARGNFNDGPLDALAILVRNRRKLEES